MRSKKGSSLAKIAGIMTTVIAIILILGSVISILSNFIDPWFMTSSISIAIFILIVGIMLLIFGMFFKKASKMMLIPEKTRRGAVLSLILGIFLFFLLISVGTVIGVLGIIAGIIGLKDSKK